MWMNRILKENRPLIKWILLLSYHCRIIEVSFYARAFLWHLKNREVKVNTIDDLFQCFYLDFLQVPLQHIDVLEKTQKTMTLGTHHECPILTLAERMGKDTREVCPKTSKGPCSYFIRKLGNHVQMENDYSRIRPHDDQCIETLRIL
jgi:hypothetical protein